MHYKNYQNHHISGYRPYFDLVISFRFRDIDHTLFFPHARGKICKILYKWTRNINKGTNLCRILSLVGVEHIIIMI